MSWPLIVVWVVLMVASYLLRPKPATFSSAPGEVEGTTVDSSSPVPVLFGTRKITKTNCVWYGDVATTPIVSCGGKK